MSSRTLRSEKLDLRLTRDAKTEEEAVRHYRRVRDEIRAFVEQLPGVLESKLK